MTKVSLIIPSFEVGGTESSFIRMANAINSSKTNPFETELVYWFEGGILRKLINPNVIITKLKVSNMFSLMIELIRYYNKFLLPMGLTYTQYLVLITIEKKTNLKIQDISNILFLNASTISPVIKRLVKLNLLKKKRDLNDERVVTVALTKSGLEILPKLSKVQEIVVCRTGMSEIDFYRFKNEQMYAT